MGGLAGGRYIGPRGTTTGDVTGGGGRSVMPNRDFLNALAARRRMIARIGRGGGAPARQEPHGPLVPPGGWQAGGDVTWQNATPEQWAALNRPAWAPEGGAWSRQARRDQHLAARGLPPSLYTGANKRYLAPHLRRAFSGPPIPPGGGYSGGVIPRFQAGGGTRPKLLPADAPWPLPPGLNYDFVGARRQHGAESIAERMANQARRRASRSPGGWQGGGAVGYGHGEDVGPRSVIDASTPAGRRKARALGQYWGPIGVARTMSGEARERAANQARLLSRSPGGWQAGGQFPEAAFPVENQLSDESPWYPDEEVGFEEAAPMQGGFDIFGRSGG